MKNHGNPAVAWGIRILCVAAVAVFAWKIWTNFFLGTESTTQISVTEGRVAVYRIEPDGTPNYIKTLKEGETLEVTGRVKAAAPVQDPTLPLFNKAVRLFLKKVNARTDMASEGKSDKFIYFFSEKVLNDEIVKPLVGPPVISIDLKVVGKEFELKSWVKMMGGNAEVVATGVVEPDPRNDRLRLKLSGLKIKNVQAPGFMLKQVENSFTQAQKDIIYPLRIISVNYASGGIIVTSQRITSETRIA